MPFARIFIVVIGSLFGGLAAAADLPVYLHEVTGLLLLDLHARESLRFQPGTPANCVATGSDAIGLTTYRCAVSGATAGIGSNSGFVQAVSFSRLVVMHKKSTDANDFIESYRFDGTWTEKNSMGTFSFPVSLTLWNYRKQPSQINGAIHLVGHGIHASVVGTQKP